MRQQNIKTILVELFEQKVYKRGCMALDKGVKNKQRFTNFKKSIKINLLLTPQELFNYLHPTKKTRQAKRKKQLNDLLKYTEEFSIIFASVVPYFLSPSSTKQIATKKQPTIVNNKIEIGQGQAILTSTEESIKPKNSVSKMALKLYHQVTTMFESDKVATGTLSSLLNELLWRNEKFSPKRKTPSRWHDTMVVVSSHKLKNTEFTGAYGKEQSIEEIMNIIYQLTPITMRQIPTFNHLLKKGEAVILCQLCSVLPY